MSPKAAAPVATSGKTKDGGYYNLNIDGPLFDPGIDMTPMELLGYDDALAESAAPLRGKEVGSPALIASTVRAGAQSGQNVQVSGSGVNETQLPAVVVTATALEPSLLEQAGAWLNEHYDKVSLATHTALSAAGAIPVLGLIPDTLDLIYTAVEMPFGKSSKTDLGLAALGVLGTLAPVGGDQVIAGAKVVARTDAALDAAAALKAAQRERVLANIESSKVARQASKFGDPVRGLDVREWPPFPGTVGQIEADFTLLPGALVDRFGPPRGSFLSPVGTPYGARALKPGSMREDYYVYETLRPLSVKAGDIRPWFSEIGDGVQFRLQPINDVRRSPSTLTEGDDPYLKEIYRGKYWDYK